MREKIMFQPGRKIKTAPGTPSPLMYDSKACNHSKLASNEINHYFLVFNNIDVKYISMPYSFKHRPQVLVHSRG